MTRQYKNPFEDPDAKLWDKKIKDYKIPKRKETPLEKKAAEYPEIGGYIYVPTIKLYVAKEKSLYGKSWENAHKELHKRSMQMLTIRQFIDFILYLKKNPNMQDVKQILDEILSERDPWRGEWLDAKFSEKERSHTRRRSGIPIKAMARPGGPNWPGTPGGFHWPGTSRRQLRISYNHRTVKGKLVAKKTESLEKCLMTSPSRCEKVDLASCNKQGLPTKRGNDMHYWLPQPGYVAGFEAQNIWTGLDCNWGDHHLYSIGVRPAFKPKNKRKIVEEEAEEEKEPCMMR